MNVYHSLDDIQQRQVYFFKPTANKLSNYVNFYKMVYNYHNFTLNTILIWVNVKSYTVHEEHNKFRVSFDTNQEFVEKLRDLELYLLKQVNRYVDKQMVLSCHKSLCNTRSIHTYEEPKDFRIYLRISGVWESECQIGLTSKLSIYSETVQNNLLNSHYNETEKYE